MNRDSKGRFCKADNETINLPMPEIGDVMYAARGYGNLKIRNEKLPIHTAVTAHKVQDIFGSGPVCFPWEHRPDDPVYLDYLDSAKHKAIMGTARHQMITSSDLRRQHCNLEQWHEYDFAEPDNFTDPNFKIGDWVYVVEFLNLIYLQIIAFKGVIVGQRFEIDKDAADTSATVRHGWNYEVYYKEASIDADNDDGLIEHSMWIPESDIYPNKEAAIEVFIAGTHKIDTLYGEIYQKLENLKPEDIKLEVKA